MTKKESQKASSGVDQETEQKKSFEEKVDKAVEGAERRLDDAMGDKTKETLSHIAQRADKLIDDIEALAESLDEIADNALPQNKGTTTHFRADYVEHVSRLFIFRFLRLIIEYRIVLVRSIRISVISIIHFLHMLLYGKRNKNLRERQMRFVRHILRRKYYIIGLVDERPDFISR